MTHKEWVKKQFDGKRTKSNYRNVLIHASFVETIVREVAGGVSFDCVIKILGANHKYKSEPLEKMDNLRNRHNDLVHEILKNKKFKTDHDINKVVKEIIVLLKEIYSYSDLVNTYFSKNFGFDPRTKF